MRDFPGRCTGAGYRPQRVVQAAFVVQVVKAYLFHVHAILVFLVHFGHKNDLRECRLDALDEPLHELRGHQFHHVAAEAVYALGGPETHDIQHFVPGGRVEVAVVNLDCFPPVVDTGSGGEAVSGGLGGHFLVAFGVERQLQGLSRVIEKVVLRGPVHGFVVIGAQRSLVLARHVVGHKVNDALETGRVRAPHQVLEFGHPALRDIGHVRIDVVVVGNGVGTPGLPFHHLFSRTGAGMPDEAGIPYIMSTEPFPILEGPGVDGRKFTVSPESGKYLVNNSFHTTNSGSS